MRFNDRGENIEDRNYFSGTGTYGINMGEGSTVGYIRILNNYFGVYIDGTNSVYTAHHIQTGAGNENTVPLDIGYNGIGNLFKVADTSVRIFSSRPVNFTYNSSDVKDGIRIQDANAQVNILNNHLGYAQSDPYFGVSLGKNQDNSIAINSSSGAVIKGNYLSASKHGIKLLSGVSGRNAVFTSKQPVIGGQGTFIGSLCNGLEANCISNNDWGGIYMAENTAAGDRVQGRKSGRIGRNWKKWSRKV